MTDRGTPVQGSQSTSRHRNPSLDETQYHHDRLNRRRPLRTGSHDSSPLQPPSPPCADEQSSSTRKTKATRNTLKKAPRRDSLHIDTQSSGHHGKVEEATGYLPRLGQIRERSRSKGSRSQASSVASSSVEPRTRRRRRTDNDAVDRPRIRHKHGTLQRHAESLAQLSNPSLVSVLSELTQDSNTSNGSNTTITQRSYDNRSLIDRKRSMSDHDSGEEPGSLNDTTMTEMETTEEHEHPNVFQYMHEAPTVEEFSDEETPQQPTSSSESSDDDSDHDGTQSSHTGSLQFAPDTPTTSPASTRMSNPELVQHASRKYRNGTTPLYASSFVHGHDEDGGDEEEEEESEEGSDEESDGGEEHDGNGTPDHDPKGGHATIAKTPPPRVPSTPSRNDDPHIRRMKQQERELANHMLKSPQPQKDFQFAGGPSPHPHNAMPLYSPRAYSDATPGSTEPTTGYPAEWFPPPLPIGYTGQPALESPTRSAAYPLTVQPPNMHMQHVGPFPPSTGQPPQYQAPFPLDGTRTTAAGYELLANKLSASSSPTKGHRKGGGQMVPMYRKFEHLNHRVLLHLQDEICELEEELRYLDECIIQMSPKDETGRAYPASRRGDARFGSEMHYKRTELLGRIFLKIGQYNQALTSFNSLVKELDPAGADDIQAYRAWIEKRAPIDDVEARFLERKNDLVAVSRRRSSSSSVAVSTNNGRGRGGQQSQSSAMWLPLMLVVPLLAFAIVPSLLGRLVVIAVIGAAGLGLVTANPDLMRYLSGQEWRTAASV